MLCASSVIIVSVVSTLWRDWEKAPAAATCLSPLASPDLAPTAAFFSPLDLDLDLRRSTAAFVLPLDLDLDLRPGTADGGGGLGGDLGGLKSRVDEIPEAAAVERCA